ncbi:MAG: DUF4169 family protein [Rubritepida sp.]|jgi:hypothetical protein|nr:DUF4169 family protein [Rubritepida sp.]
MGEIVNLRRARKAKAKAEEATVAARNRALHGRTRAARAEDEAEAARRALADRALEAARLPPGDGKG